MSWVGAVAGLVGRVLPPQTTRRVPTATPAVLERGTVEPAEPFIPRGPASLDGRTCPRCDAVTLRTIEGARFLRYCSRAGCLFGIDTDVEVKP
jgi:hypothetical protein